jgi:hypothetical protein
MPERAARVLPVVGTAGQRARLLAESRAPLVLRTDGREQGAPSAWPRGAGVDVNAGDRPRERHGMAT